MNFPYLNVENNRGFTSTVVSICSDTSCPFGVPPRRKCPYLEILKLPVAELNNKDNKFALVLLDEDVSLEISS